MRSNIGRFTRKAGPRLVRFAGYFGIVGLVVMGGIEAVDLFTQQPSPSAIGMRGTIEPSDDVVFVATNDADWIDATGALGLKAGSTDTMAPAPYLLR